jgi:hypothetical protein
MVKFKLSKKVVFVSTLLLFSEPSIAKALDLITNQTQLEGIINDLTKDYVLGNDIYLDSPMNSQGNYYVEGEFIGTFDGNDYKIMGLVKPLFEEVGAENGSSGALIKDLYLGGSIIDGEGFLSKQINSLGVIQNVGARGSIISDNKLNVGGLVGRNNGLVSNSYTDVDVSGTAYDPSVGGLVGINNGQIVSSYSIGDVTAISSGAHGEVGGLVGLNQGSISNSFSEGDVTVNVQQGLTAGGLTGENNYGVISNSFASGSVSGIGAVGGLVGSNMFSTVENTYSIGDVNGVLFVGGLIGSNLDDTTIRNSYSTSDVYCEILETCGALIGMGSNTRVTVENSIGKGAISLNSLPVSNPNQNTIIPELLSVVGDTEFTIETCYNSGKPILRNLRSTFEDSCSLSEGSSTRYRINTMGTITPELSKVSPSFGFVANSLNLERLGIQTSIPNLNSTSNYVNSLTFFVNSISEATIKQNQGLQIKLQYSSFSPVQLWIKDSTGKSIYVGDLTFDSEGKVVLPILLFTMLGQKELLLIESEDSDQLQNTQRQIGRLIINVVED